MFSCIAGRLMSSQGFLQNIYKIGLATWLEQSWKKSLILETHDQWATTYYYLLEIG